VHVTRPVVEVFADAAASSRGFGARGEGNIGGESKVVGGPPVVRLASGVAVSVSVFHSGGNASHRSLWTGMCVMSLILPGPYPCRYDVVEERVFRSISWR
jgi:hypothetical protein